MGSVKDLQIIKRPTETELGRGDFAFSDRKSVRDWGELPDHLKLSGAALALMGAKTFEEQKKAGYKVHYLGLVEDGKVLQLSELSGPSNIMAVELTRVIHPEYIEPIPPETKGTYDYSYFIVNQGKLNNYLIALECIYRNGMPLGSSMIDKLADGRLTIGELGLSVMPNAGDMFDRSLYDFSTKLEKSGDRMIKSRDEQLEISGLTQEQFSELESVLHGSNDVITNQCAKVGLKNWDGKLEMMWYNGPVIVDVAGTPDECRFSLDSLQVSKEVLRQWYVNNDSKWESRIKDYKKNHGTGWKQAMINAGLTPKPLPEQFLNLVSEMYASCANTYCENKFFDVRPLSEVMSELEETGTAIYVSA